MDFVYQESFVRPNDDSFERDDESDIELEDIVKIENEELSDNECRKGGTNKQSDSIWLDTMSTVSVKQENCTEVDGPLHDLPKNSEPIDYFKLFLPDNVMENMALETNRYAEQQQLAKGTPDPYWKPVSAEEISRYIYINIIFGLHQLPDIRLYWSNDAFWRVSAVADVLGRQRYQKIHQYFHLTDSTHQPQRGVTDYDPLYKVRPLLEHVRSTCSSVYKPMRDLNMDEAMIGHTGRLRFKQCARNKPTTWGTKIWCCVESKTGYILNFQVYAGKHETCNQGIFSVDHNDHHHLYYPVGRSGSKVWRHIVWYLVQISIINSFLLMKRAQPKADKNSAAGNHLVFRTQLVKSLLNRFTTISATSEKIPQTPTFRGMAKPHSSEHRLSIMPGRQRRCYQCAVDGHKMPSGRTRETTTGCPLCNIHLHGGLCYSKYHDSLRKQ